MVILPGSIVFPLKGAEVGKVVRAAFGNGGDVVNLPSVLTGSVPIEIPTYPGTTLVLAPYCRVVATNNLRLFPDSKFSFFAKICHFEIGFVKHPAPMGSTSELFYKDGFDARERLPQFLKQTIYVPA